MQHDMKPICEEFSKGNFQAVYPYFADDVQWIMVGDQVMKGKEEVIEGCEKMLQEITVDTLINTSVTCDTNRIAIEGYCEFLNSESIPATVYYCDVYHFESNVIKSIASYAISQKKEV